MQFTKYIFGILLLISISHGQLIKTLSTSERRHLDSLNLHIENIRLNQTGYRTDVNKKSAFVELSSPDEDDQKFNIINPAGEIVYENTLTYLGDYMHLNGKINITGYYSSIVPLYHFESEPDKSEYLYEAEFGDLKENGSYRIVVNQDTSFQFEIRENIYNDIFEMSLHYFGIQRSGDTESWFHPKSHTLDGSARGPGKEGSLAGGWFDCGDHFKVSQTTAYTFMNLTLTYLFWPEKSEDRYGHSYAQTAPNANDGIPDLLWEAKIGADYVYKLYVASVEDGLIEKNDMYQQVGVSLEDHQLWIRPEFQDYQSREKGGPDRKIDAGAGADMGGQFAGTLAFFASAWEKYDRNYSKKLLDAAIDIYENIVLYDVTRKSWADGLFYPTQVAINDDVAMGALGLWYATGDPQYKYDLMENEDFGIGNSSMFNMDEFHAGFLATTGSLFSPGGWMSDYQNSHLQVIAAMYMLFYRDSETAHKWGIPNDELDDIQERIITLLKKRLVGESAAGDNRTNIVEYLDVVEVPYNLRWTSIAWGFNRYNMGAVIPVAMTAEILEIANDPLASTYRDVVIDNLDYVLGKNPWNISFLVGAGEKNLQHIHHRGANPEGYNAGGVPYEYTVPTGAFMAGSVPGSTISDLWLDYTNTETCIDYSSQLLLVAQLMSKELPEDKTKPSLFKIMANPVNVTSATIRLENDELTNDSLSLYLDTTESPIEGIYLTSQDKKVWRLENLEPKTKYWVKLESKDVFENQGEDVWLEFTTTSEKIPPNWEEAGVCKISHESATVNWWSPNQFGISGIFWGETKSDTEKQINYIEEKEFGSFHQVEIDGLKPNTTYYYSRISGDSVDTNNGKYYQFTTREAFVNYSLYIKPVSKSGATAFYVEITNNEQAAYAGLELRIYMEIEDYDVDNIQVSTYDKQIFDVGGLPQGSNFTIGDFVAIDASQNQYYLPITVDDTIPSAGRARMDLIFKILDEHGSESSFDVEKIKNSWSFTSKSTPEEYVGVPWDKMDVYVAPDPVEIIDGEAETTFILNQYIPVYYKGVHVYGYPPNWGDNRVKSLKTFEITTDSPFYMDSEKVTTYLNTDFLMGEVTVFPHGTITDIEINGGTQSFELGSTSESATFDIQEISKYDPIIELVTWSDRNTDDCSYEYKRWIIDPKNKEESSSSEESSSAEDVESSSSEEQSRSSSSEEYTESSEEEFDEPIEVSQTKGGLLFSLLFDNKLYVSSPLDNESDDRISMEPYKDKHGFTIEVLETPENYEDYLIDFEGYIYTIDGQYIDNFLITKTGKELNENSNYSIRLNNRDEYGNIKDNAGRLLGTGVYLLCITITERVDDSHEQSFVLERIGYARTYH